MMSSQCKQPADPMYFTCGLADDAVSMSDYTALNYRVIHEQ